MSDTNRNGDKSHFTSCELEAQGKINAGLPNLFVLLLSYFLLHFTFLSSDNRKIVFENGRQTVIIEDSTSYHCSFGLYTEELKYSAQSKCQSFSNSGMRNNRREKTPKFFLEIIDSLKFRVGR